ncbi:MAG: hypothetical protein LBS53_14030 [Synergistaceae bacterium]|nr:hypothetical protein [Synergistaceae bacterium]
MDNLGKVGVSEAPSPGGSHPTPGVLESFVGSVPTICLTSDVPYNYDKRNMLSGFDQNKLYSAITKESMLVTSARDIPFVKVLERLLPENSYVEVHVDDQSRLVPPIPRWIPNAVEKGIPYHY